MVALWRGRRWWELLNLIDHLPAQSHFGEAMADDEDMARAYLARFGNDRPAARPRFIDFDPTLSELTVIADRLSEVLAAIAALGGGKVKVHPRPRPRIAIDRMREAIRVEKHNNLVARLLPGRST